MLLIHYNQQLKENQSNCNENKKVAEEKYVLNNMVSKKDESTVVGVGTENLKKKNRKGDKRGK
jgi:hypothetical protein